MAKIILTDAAVLLNGTSLSDHATQVTVEQTADEVDLTTFGPSGYKQFGVGFKDATITVSILTDFAASSIDAMVSPMYQANSVGSVQVRPTSAAISSTNPAYMMGSAVLTSYNPIAGGVGDASSTDLSFRNFGTAGIVRGTS